MYKVYNIYGDDGRAGVNVWDQLVGKFNDEWMIPLPICLGVGSFAVRDNAILVQFNFNFGFVVYAL
jgi:hypothetical protein